VSGLGLNPSLRIKQAEIEKALAASGWMVIIGNGKLNAQQAHRRRQNGIWHEIFG
jgi:hypothetical protein